MKRALIIVIVSVFISCTTQLPGTYKGGNYVQFFFDYQVILNLSREYISSPYPYAPYVSLSEMNQQDTVYFRLHIAGEVSKEPRHVRLIQYKDTTNTWALYPQAGVNYIGFDDPIMLEALTIPGDSAYINIPIVVKYDPASAGTYQSFQLDFQLIDSEDLEVGEQFLSKGRFSFYQN